MTRTITVEGRGTVSDTNVPLTAQGEEATPDRKVPSGATRLIAIYGGVGADLLAAGGGVAILKLSDGGISGKQIIALGAQGGDLPQSGSDRAGALMRVFLDDREIPGGIDLKVTELKQLTIEVEMPGTDLGDFDGIITLVFA